MRKAGIYYGTTRGTTEGIVRRIAPQLHITEADIHDVAYADAASINTYEVLLLGCPTWGIGELQEDWQNFLPQLKNQDLHIKTVALFGCGDSLSYDTHFCDAIGTLYDELQKSGCKFCGFCEKDGYSFSKSKAFRNNHFVGLPLDEDNESDLTESRLWKWIVNLREECRK